MSRSGSIGIAPEGSHSEVLSGASDEDGDDYSDNFADETGTVGSDKRSNEAEEEVPEVAESVASEQSGSFSYTEDFDATMTSKSEALLDEAAASASASAQDLSISENVDKKPEVNLEAQREERRKEIAKRQEADAQRTAVLRKVSDASFDDISEEDIPSEVENASEASFYDPDAKRREEELEKQQKEEEERKRKELEAAEAERKQQQIEEANRKLAAERRKNMEEEEARKRAEEEKLAEQRKKAEEEKRKQEEEKRKRDEELIKKMKEEQLREEERRKEQRKEAERQAALEKQQQLEEEQKRNEAHKLSEQVRSPIGAKASVFKRPAEVMPVDTGPAVLPSSPSRLSPVGQAVLPSSPSRLSPVGQAVLPSSPSRLSPVGHPRPEHKVDEAVRREEVSSPGESLRLNVEKQAQLATSGWQSGTSLDETQPAAKLQQEVAPQMEERARYLRQTEETLWDRSEGSPDRLWSNQDWTQSSWRGWSWKQDWWQPRHGWQDWWSEDRFPSPSTESRRNSTGLWLKPKFDEGPLVRLQQFHASEGTAAFSPPSRTATPSQTFQTDTGGTATAGTAGFGHMASGATEVSTWQGPPLALPLPERPRPGGSAGPLPARHASKSEVQDTTLATPLRMAAAMPVAPAEGFEEALQWAVLAVLEDMMQLKYGCSMDLSDLRRHLATNQCWKVEHLNGLEFFGDDGSQKIQLQISAQDLNFQELRAVLRHFAGSASAVLFTSAAPCAALRMDGAGQGVIGRGKTGLQRVAAEDASHAWALEPTALDSALTTTAEWQQLYDAAKGGGSTRISPHLLFVLHARLPTSHTLRAANAALSSCDSEKNRLELFKRLLGWLEMDESAEMLRESLKEVPELRRTLLKSFRAAIPKEPLFCEAVAQLVGKVSKCHAENASSLVQLGAAQDLCHAMARHRSRKDLQRHGLYAVACLVYDGGGAAQALAAEAIPLALRAMSIHQKSASVQVKACEVLRLLVELSSEVPLDEIAEAAMRAKRLFPSDGTVHRAVDLLLSFAVPRSAACIGALMDAATRDETVQRSAICSLGHLAKHGGVAWRGASTTAVNRILRALQHHKGSVPLQAAGLWALGRLAERLDAPGRGGMQDAAQRAKQMHPDSALVQRHADELIAFLLRP